VRGSQPLLPDLGEGELGRGGGGLSWLGCARGPWLARLGSNGVGPSSPGPFSQAWEKGGLGGDGEAFGVGGARGPWLARLGSDGVRWALIPRPLLPSLGEGELGRWWGAFGVWGRTRVMAGPPRKQRSSRVRTGPPPGRGDLGVGWLVTGARRGMACPASSRGVTRLRRARVRGGVLRTRGRWGRPARTGQGRSRSAAERS
jgi:hypothetical protein